MSSKKQEKKFFRSDLRRPITNASTGNSCSVVSTSKKITPPLKRTRNNSSSSSESNHREGANPGPDLNNSISTTCTTTSVNDIDFNLDSKTNVILKPVPKKAQVTNAITKIPASSVILPSSSTSGFTPVNSTYQGTVQNDCDSLSDDSDTSNSDDGFGSRVGHMMKQLESKLENRIKMKTLKLSKSFEDVLSIPVKISRFHEEQSKHRDLLEQKLRASFKGLKDDLQNALDLQRQNFEKCSKMLGETVTNHEDSSNIVLECKTQQNSALTNFMRDEEKLNQKLSSEERQFVDQSNKEIGRLQRRLEHEVEKQEVQRLL